MYSIALLAAAVFSSSQFKLFEHFNVADSDWDIVSRADERATIDLKIAIKNSNMDKLISKLYAVSDPKSFLYGKHLSKNEVDALVAPSSESFQKVTSWLSSFGITGTHISGDFVTATITIGKAQEILKANYSVYEYDDTRLVRTESYSLPEDLHEHVDFVQPTTTFSRFHEAPVEDYFVSDDPNYGTPLAGCTSKMTIQCLNTLYNMNGFTPSGKTKIGVTGYLGEYANRKDLDSFMGKYYPNASGYDFHFQSVSNGTNSQEASDAGVEAALDIQYVVGLTYPSKSVFYSTAGSPPFIPDGITPTNTNEPYLDWLIYMSGLSDDEIPSVVTTSYGDNEQTVPFSYANRVCNEFAKLGARGVSVLFSSGDGGGTIILTLVAGGRFGDCKSNDGSKKRKFLPTFPASCPFVTSVGGTHQIPESAVEFSSGGFSEYFSRPDYQNAAVTRYLRSFGEHREMYNSYGRGIPDVAAYGTQFPVFVAGFIRGVSGTSASAPAFAAVVANLNDKLGRKLGFLNPWIYGGGYTAMNDITTGNSEGCGTNGFPALKGWDPVTGYGTPNFFKMAENLAKK